MRGGALIWPLRIVLIACCAAAPWFVGAGYAAAVLLALPILRALLDAMHEHIVACVCVLSGCLCAALLFPAWLRPAIALWGAGLMAMSVLRVRAGSRTMLAGLALAAATAVITLALALPQSGGQLVPWLAQAIVDRIDGHPNSATMLLNAYQAGLARLEGDMALIPALRIFGAIIIPPDTRLELLYSLRASIESLLTSLLPRGIVLWMLLTALLPAIVAEGVLRGAGRHSDLPPLERWYMPRRLTNAVVVMMMLGFLPYLTASAPLVSLGEMCYTLGYWACALQGASLMLFLMVGRGVRPLGRWLLVALGVLFLPLALFFLGGYDQFRDPRHLRGPAMIG